MAEIEVPRVTYQNAQRFQVMPLPLWSLALTKLGDEPASVTGIGFDRDARIAVAKSHSEAIERWVAETWAASGRSPLDRKPGQPPPGEAGMAAHPIAVEARYRAFAEWRERVLLEHAARGAYRLAVTEPPRFGALFEKLLEVTGVDLQCYGRDGDFPLGFAIGFLKKGGVIFGSAVRAGREDAVLAAAGECLRKIAFLKSWRMGQGRTSQTEAFLDTVAFWLSGAGEAQARQFLEGAILAPVSRDAVPTQPSPQFFTEARLGKWYVCTYYDPAYALPRVIDKRIPLV